MADMVLTCPACGKQITVSEYVSEKTVPCHSCNHVIPIPERKKTTPLGLRRQETASGATITPLPTWSTTENGPRIPIPSMGQKRFAFVARNIRRVRIHRIMISFGWVVFAILAAVLYYIRFHHGCPGVPLEEIKKYGLIAIGASYLFIILLALKDNMFDGLLSMVVPLYPFYYLFFVSGAVFVRAIVGALLIAFGLDFLTLLQALFTILYDKINYWIQHV